MEPQKALFLPGWDNFFDIMTAVLIMTCGTMFLMWIGEQIDEYGIGNGISLIIMAGIVSRLPEAFKRLFFIENGTKFNYSIFQIGGANGGPGLETLIVLILLFICGLRTVLRLPELAAYRHAVSQARSWASSLWRHASVATVTTQSRRSDAGDLRQQFADGALFPAGHD